MASKYLRRSLWWIQFSHPVTRALIRESLDTTDEARAELLRERLDHEVGIPARLPKALVRFRRLLGEGVLSPATLLHEFLEVDDSLPNWLAENFERDRMIPGRDYVRVPELCSLGHSPV